MHASLQALQGDSSLASDAPRTKSEDDPLLDFHVGPAHVGHLRCLLNMGHLQGMLAEVDGWAQQAKGASTMSSLTFWQLSVNYSTIYY
jgi:hypothetical protein